MDRGHGHRAVLGAALVALVGGSLRAQGPTPTATASPAVAATPWVQASSPPARPVPRTDKSPTPGVPLPSTSPSKEEIARAMARKREVELARQAAPVTTAKPLPPKQMQRLSPEDGEAYERNLALWQTLPPEEKKDIRALATERTREETEKAYASSGLNLNDDQREVFALRYRQERRRVEREIQDKVKAERARRLPEIIDQLKHEFATGTPPAPSATATPPPAKP